MYQRSMKGKFLIFVNEFRHQKRIPSPEKEDYDSISGKEYHGIVRDKFRNRHHKYEGHHRPGRKLWGMMGAGNAGVSS